MAKLNDAETEASETQVHLEIALNHKYIDGATFEALDDRCDKIISQIVKMIDRADRWIIKPAPVKRRSTRYHADTPTHRNADTFLLGWTSARNRCESLRRPN